MRMHANRFGALLTLRFGLARDETIEPIQRTA
jgi:hypothetical protein